METKNKKEEKKPADSFKIHGDWSKQSKALRNKYPTLTSDDVKFETGKETDLFKRMENRLSKNRNEVISILKTNQEAVV